MMIRRFAFSLAAAALVLAAAPSIATSAQDDLYARMQRVNTGLNSYQADVTVAIKINTYP